MKKTTMPGMPEVEVVEIKTSAPVNVLADPAPAKKPAAKRTRKTAAAKTTAAKTEAKKPAAKRGRKPKAATAAAKKAEGPKKRGRPHQHRRGPYRLSGADPHHQGHPGRRFLRESGSDERDQPVQVV